MSSTTVVEIQNLKKTYRDGFIWGKKYEALKGVDLAVFGGEIFGLLGPNGAGKTTMIKILLGILHPTAGRATVLGEPAGSKAARSRIGYLPENVTFPRHHTGRHALYFYGRLNNVPEAEIQRKEPELLELVGLRGRESEPVRKYSKGMRQRLGLAQAMMHDPDILIMDEPTDGLDPVGRSQIRGVIEELRSRGKTIFLNSHILQEVEMVCDRVAILARGQLRGLGTTRELTSQFRRSLVSKILFELQGEADRIARAIEESGMPLALPEAGSGGGSETIQSTNRRYAFEVNDQSQIDRLVDCFRQEAISIVSMEPSRTSLEDVFMSVVDSANLSANPSEAK